MIGIRRVVVIGLMTADTRRVGSGQIVVVVLVTIGTSARRHRMASGEHESGHSMVEVGIRPAIGVMAFLAGRIGKKATGGVRRIGRAVEILLVTADAIGGHRGELAERSVLMTVLASRGGMCPGQREAVVVHVDLGDGNFPSPDRVAVFAVGGHLAAVDVGVAVSALGADITEHHLGVAVHAIDALVHPAQRKLGLIVIEFRDGSDRLPTVSRVAVLACDVQRAVRAASVVRGHSQCGAKNRYQ